jgi:DNA-binding LytR/AlgR family response regulator
MSLKALIIEDEPLALRRLEKLIRETDPEIEIIGRLDSISSSIRWFEKNKQPDLLFLDIHLGDGLSFDIFASLEITCPVIFTTAYDQYAIKAFKLNSIDYLLKPIKPEELRFSIEKFKKVQVKDTTAQLESIRFMLDDFKNRDLGWKKRFIVNFGDKIKAIETADIAYFMILDKNSFLITHSNDSFGINFSLDQLEGLLNPAEFFRVNRKFMVNFSSIKNMWSYSRARVKIQLEPEAPEPVIVSTDRSAGFKEWLNK